MTWSNLTSLSFVAKSLTVFKFNFNDFLYVFCLSFFFIKSFLYVGLLFNVRLILFCLSTNSVPLPVLLIDWAYLDNSAECVTFSVFPSLISLGDTSSLDLSLKIADRTLLLSDFPGDIFSLGLFLNWLNMISFFLTGLLLSLYLKDENSNWLSFDRLSFIPVISIFGGLFLMLSLALSSGLIHLLFLLRMLFENISSLRLPFFKVFLSLF